METVLIIEDDAALSRGLKDNFAFQGYAVLLAADGEKGFELAVNARPALIVLDLMLPKMNGYEICKRLRRSGLEMPILVLTAKSEESDVVLGLELGADDYVKKPFSIRELLARAEALLRRRRQGEPERWTFGGYTLDVRSRTLAGANGKPMEVSPKEFALLHFFLQRAGQALSREEILNHVWGYDVSVTPRSIDRFVATLRRKIETDSQHPRHILTAREFGYKFSIDGQPGTGEIDAPAIFLRVERLLAGLDSSMFDPDKVIPRVEGAISLTEQAIARLEKIVGAVRRSASASPMVRPHSRRPEPARLQALTALYTAGTFRSC